MNRKKINLKIFILPIINMFFFIMISSFGQTFLMEIGLSFIVALILLLIFIYNIKRIPVKILLIYLLLIAYSAILSIGKKNWDFWTISIFTIAASFSTLKLELKDSEWKSSFFITAIFSNIVLLLYDYRLFLVNWNPNTIAMFCVIGMMGYIISFTLERNIKKKFLIFIIMMISIYMLYMTDSRNAMLMYIIAFISCLFAKKIFRTKIILKIYTIFSLIASGLVAMIVNVINNLEIMEKILVFSKEVFGKATLFSNREIFWEECKYYIGNNWLFGTGNSLYEKMYSHNMFYSAVYAYGLIGFIIYIAIIYQIIKFIYKYAKEDLVSITSSLIFLAIMYGQITENMLFTSDTNVFFAYIFLSIGLSRAINNKEKKKNEKNNCIHTDL